MNSLRGYIIVAGALILTGILIAASILIIHHKESFTPPAPIVGRFQLRIEDTTAIIFDTATGRFYVLDTNRQFFVRDPVWETSRPWQHYHPASNGVPNFTPPPPASPRLPTFGDKTP